MKKELNEMWDECAKIIRENISLEQFDTIFASIKPKSFIDDKLILTVADKSVYEAIEKHYLDLMTKVIFRVFKKNVKWGYSVQSNKKDNSCASKTSDTSNITSDKDVNMEELNSQLFPRYTFDNFIEGDSNRLVRSVGLAIAKNPAKTFNPLFIYGPSGCGKTHLINAIGWAVKQQHPNLRVLYLSAHLFYVQYTDAVRQNKINDFINFYQTIDVILMDDIQELSGKIQTQNTFFHIFNHLHLNNKQIIITADRPPIEITGLEDRLLTRFKWGLQAEIERPNKNLCKSIINNKVKNESLPISDNVCNYIAEKVNGSVRDIEGVINALMAFSVVYRCEITLNLADKVLPKFIHVDDTPITIKDIKQGICKQFNISESELISQSRRQPLAQTRHIAIFLASKLTNMSNTQIGENMGGRNHATVLHSINYVKNLCETDSNFNKQLSEIEEQLIRNR